MTYKLFLDESCHFEKDRSSVMCIGYIKVPEMAYDELYACIRKLKLRYKSTFELKWNKFSYSRIEFYKALVDLFFNSPLEFKCILVKYKDRLSHEEFNGGPHGNFYYKITYFLLKPTHPEQIYKVYLDVINTRGKERLDKIQESFKDLHHGKSPFLSFQHLHTENLFFQLTDLFVGAITYKTRISAGDLKEYHPGKAEFIQYLEQKAGYVLEQGSEPWETKFNILDHQPNMNTHGDQ